MHDYSSYLSHSLHGSRFNETVFVIISRSCVSTSRMRSWLNILHCILYTFLSPYMFDSFSGSWISFCHEFPLLLCLPLNLLAIVHSSEGHKRHTQTIHRRSIRKRVSVREKKRNNIAMESISIEWDNQTIWGYCSRKEGSLHALFHSCICLRTRASSTHSLEKTVTSRRRRSIEIDSYTFSFWGRSFGSEKIISRSEHNTNKETHLDVQVASSSLRLSSFLRREFERKDQNSNPDDSRRETRDPSSALATKLQQNITRLHGRRH